MACTRPMPAARGPGGGIVFTTRAGWADKLLELPCGKCSACRADLAQDWALRCTHEAMCHTHPDGGSRNSFITLTFEENGLVERQAKQGTHPQSLDKRDWQLFAKRLRKRIGPFRFLMSAEYGENNTRRPHYHALIFGYDFSENRTLWRTKNGRSYFRSETLTETWPYGFHDLQQLVPQHINYVCQYVRKKLGGPMAEADLKRLDTQTGKEISVAEPFALMSRGGRHGNGLGAEWFKKFGTDAFPSDFLVAQGTKKRVPRYYLDKLEKQNPDAARKVRAKRQKKANEKPKDWEKHQKNKAKEAIEKTKQALYPRTQPNHID